MSAALNAALLADPAVLGTTCTCIFRVLLQTFFSRYVLQGK